ncbi:endo alpha-1,4 polygalactosaminidase [Deinococcus arenicola]|uniref:Endo alpha-1,4 polygalactosaminidase n=1 Tax=Deinococcus arenicola TaxID=2994950 RepID=A0ABU4DS66_9DEIO|nr:endo alpha-1,4 polygalactosaminidase [Deinococcus sp. ZS9-10]MDV6375278.1 endo alpha-1,4 polygalactosaminidase [Deinococcus sp. ZS9-10]
MTAISMLSPYLPLSVYYGPPTPQALKALRGFRTAVVQPTLYTPAQLAALRAGGAQILGYLSVGEDHPYGEYPCTPGCAAYHLEVNSQWGSVRVDLSDPAWWAELLRRAAAQLQHTDGLFLDTLDSGGAEGTLALVQTLRTAFPKAILLANRGFGLLPGLARLVDGVLFEGFSTTHTPVYGTLDKQGQDYTAHWLKEVRAQGLSVSALDYANTPALARAARERAARYNVQTFVSDRALSLAGGFPA